MEEYNFEIEDALGRKVVLNCLATIKDTDNEDDYIIYTDGTFDEDYDPVIYVAKVIHNEEGITLQPVEDYKQIDAITQKLDEISHDCK